MALKGIIFDLDGTLVDTFEDLTESMRFGLERLGVENHASDLCPQRIGDFINLPDAIERFAEYLLGREHRAHLASLIAMMRGHYDENCTVRTRPYRGIEAALGQLRGKGVRLAVLTNKEQNAAERIVRHYFGGQTFEPVIGNAEDRNAKPHPDGVYAILERWGLEPADVALVGDSFVDVRTAQAAKIASVGVTWAYCTRDELHAEGAQTVLDEPEEIVSLLS